MNANLNFAFISNGFWVKLNLVANCLNSNVSLKMNMSNASEFEWNQWIFFWLSYFSKIMFAFIKKWEKEQQIVEKLNLLWNIWMKTIKLIPEWILIDSYPDSVSMQNVFYKANEETFYMVRGQKHSINRLKSMNRTDKISLSRWKYLEKSINSILLLLSTKSPIWKNVFSLCFALFAEANRI